MLTLEQVNQLHDFQQEVTMEELEVIYGTEAGRHLWRKFNDQCGGNLLHLFAKMDALSKALLVYYLNGGR